MSEPLKLPRVDIQALRGLAVLLVVLYHTNIAPVAGGYLGVDVFFVISGFLITTLVAKGINRGDFLLKEFYFRRAKRLLPAAYVTFAITATLGPWFLNQQELKDFATQMLGAITFSGNFVLWQQTGYFEGASDLKPLLHVWSLAIEEQYYFILPAALLFTRPSRWLAGCIVLVLLSFGLCIIGGIWKPIATFYLIPTRAWELLIGSVGALWLLQNQTNNRKKLSQIIQLLFPIALVCLLLLPFTPFNGFHPGLNALLMSVATLVVILRKSSWLNDLWPTRTLAWIGDFSYSLYLVHWPIIAFMKNAWVGDSPELPINFRVAAFSLSFALAYLLYRFVEDPIRRSSVQLSWRSVSPVLASTLLLGSITPIVISTSLPQLDFNHLRRANIGFSSECNSIPYVRRGECENSATPDLLVWGDSFAMHFVDGLSIDWKGQGVIQATKSQCGPFLKLAPRQIIMTGRPGDYIGQKWAEQCISFNNSVVELLRETHSIKTVVLSSPFSRYLTTTNHEHVTQVGSVFISSQVSVSAAVSSLKDTVEHIRALGKSVVLIAPPPSLGFNIGGCLERQLSGAVALGGRVGCVIDRAEYALHSANVRQFLALVAKEADVPVISFDPWLCDTTMCKTLLDGTMIYRDGGHLSYAGSRLLARRMHMAQLIKEQAR